MKSTHLEADEKAPDQRPPTLSTDCRRSNPINSRILALFVIELLLLAAVCWYFIVNRHSLPYRSSNVASLQWGSLCAVAVGWSTVYFVLSQLAAKRWRFTQSWELLAIAVAAGAVALGILILSIARVLAANSAFVDARPPYAVKLQPLPTEVVAGLAGNAKDGMKWYGMSCMVCHGPTGDGVPNTAPSLLASEFCQASDEATIAALIRNGRSATDSANKTGKVMPAKGGNPFLSESKIADLVAYLKELNDHSPTGGTGSPGADSSLYFAAADAPNEPLAVVHEWTLDELAGLDVTATEELIGVGSQAFVKATCSKCHMAAVAGKGLGPTLDQIAKKYRREELLQHIVHPSLEINEKFQDHTFFLMDGRIVTGVIASQTDEQFEVITNLLEPETLTTIAIDDIDEQVKSKVSPMPAGLLNVLAEQEIAGLVAYVDALGSQMAAASTEPPSESLVSASTSEPARAPSQSVTPTLSDSIPSQARLKSGLSFPRLFVIVTSLLILHFLWSIGAGTALLLHRELRLSSGARVQHVQQTLLFWIVGVVWLAVWFTAFFLIG